MTCDASGKTCHKNKAAAYKQIKHLVRRGGLDGRVYKCEHCGYFHITKSRDVIFKKLKD